MLGAGMDVGEIRARLGAEFDDDAFDRFDRRVDAAERRARNPIDQRLGTKTDVSGLDRYDRRLRDVDDGHRRLERSGGRLASFLGTGVRTAGLAAAAGIGAAVVGGKELLGAFGEAERVTAQTNAVLKSTRGEAGLTAKEISALATEVSRYSGMDDEAVQSAENMLLTFTNVRNEVGKGKDVFSQATKTAADMSTALGTDVTQSAMMLGKALNDPIRGMTALRRVGVTFTEQQQDQVKAMVEANDMAGAQGIILAELQKEFGGSAKAAGDTFTGSINKAKVAVGNLAEGIGARLAPMVKGAADWITDFASSLTDADRPAHVIGDTFKGLGETVGGVFRWIRNAIEDLVNDRGVQQFASKVGRFVGALADDIGTLIRNIVAKVRSVGPELETIGRAIMTVAGAIVDVLREVLPGVRRAIEGVVDIVKGFVKILAGILTLDFGKVWEGVKDIVGGALKAIGGLISAATKPIRAAFGAIFRGIGDIAEAAWDTVTGAVKAGLDFILGGVTTMLGIMGDIARAGSKLPFVGGKFKDLADEIDGTKNSLDKFRESLRKGEDDTRPMTKAIGEASGRVDTLKDRLRTLKKGTDDYRTTARELRRAQDDLNKAMRAADGAGRKGAAGIATIAGGAFSASEGVGAAAGTIKSNVDRLARELGAQGVNFTVAKTPQGRRTQNNVFGPLGPTLARGGHVVGGDPNARGRDDRILLGPDGRPEAVVGAGELLVFNADQVAAVKEAINARFGVSLGEFYAAPWKPHHLTRHARGGQIPDFYLSGPAGDYRDTGNGGLRKLDRAAEAKIRRLEASAASAGGGAINGSRDTLGIQAMLARMFGLSPSSGYRDPAHNAAVGGVPNSMHTHGTPSRPGAVDLVGPMGAMQRALAYAQRRFHPAEAMIHDAGSGLHLHLGFFARGGLLRFGKGGKMPAWARKANTDFQMGRKAAAGANSRMPGLAKYDREISALERGYSQFERAFSMDDKPLVKENDEGAYIDQKALDDQTGDLSALRGIREAIKKKIGEYQQAAERAREIYRESAKRIRQAIAHVDGALARAPKGEKGKTTRQLANKRLETYKEALSGVSGRRVELRDLIEQLEGDKIDAKLDIRELGREIKALDPKKVLPGAAEDDQGVWRTTDEADTPDISTSQPEAPAPGGDTGGGSDPGPAVPDTPTTAAPTPEEIAAAAMAQFSAFKEAAQSAFAEFGSNAVRAGANPFATEAGQMAGLNYFGASQDTAPRVQQVNHITLADAGETHVFTQSALHELQAAAG